MSMKQDIETAIATVKARYPGAFLAVSDAGRFQVRFAVLWSMTGSKNLSHWHEHEHEAWIEAAEHCRALPASQPEVVTERLEPRAPEGNQTMQLENVRTAQDWDEFLLDKEAEIIEMTPSEEFCNLPPMGWWCSRKRGHEGPCAARKTAACHEVRPEPVSQSQPASDTAGQNANRSDDAKAWPLVYRFAKAKGVAIPSGDLGTASLLEVIWKAACTSAG